MQPLISPIDHESRHNSHRAEDVREVREETPLLRRFPETVVVNRRHPITTLVVSLLLVILVSGVIIGIYLLVLQSNSENILPPVDNPVRLVSRLQWDNDKNHSTALTSPFKADRVIIVQTDTATCHSTSSCTDLLRNMQANATNQVLPYNFLISSNGQTYEALGWHKTSPLFPEYSPALVLAVIGNFTDASPTAAQIDETKNFIADSASRQYLSLPYTIIGKKINKSPTFLFLSMQGVAEWDSDASDKF